MSSAGCASSMYSRLCMKMLSFLFVRACAMHKKTVKKEMSTGRPKKITIMCQYDYAFMCLRTLFCLTNISAPWYHTKLVLYSKFAYMDLSFQEEKTV